jgi:DNA primase
MEFVDQLKSSVDIVQTIGEYVRLRKTGQRYTGLCPFHNEKTPSFSVNPQHQFFKCFGCGEAGDVISFVMKYEGISFQEALKQIAERNGIPMPKRTGYADEETRHRASVYRMHEVAEKEFQKQLHGDAGAEARRYLTGRGVSEESIVRFGIGYAPRGNILMRVLRDAGFTSEEMEHSGLVLKREDGTLFDRFRNRLMFPIHNESGKPIAFGGRALAADDQPKYMNSPETKIYRKSHVLYNMHRAKEGIRKLDRAVLVEGYMDAIGATTAGVAETIASCGTSLTAQQVQQIRRQTQNIVVNFDPDAAGANAAERSIQMLLAEGMRVRIVTLEGGLDPDEYAREHGGEAYQHHIAHAQSYFHWLADRAKARYDVRSAEGRYAAFQFLLPAIQGLSDKLERVAVANDVAGSLGVEPGLVLDQFRKMAGDRREAASSTPLRETLRHADRILLRVLVSGEEIPVELFEMLDKLESRKTCTAARIYDAVITIYRGGAGITYAALHARLAEADQQLLAEALLINETDSEQPTLEEGFACIERLAREEQQQTITDLKARIRDISRRGDLAEALKLQEELVRVERKSPFAG